MVIRHTHLRAATAAFATLLFTLAASLSAAPAPKQTPPLAWVFQVRHDAQTNPHTNVFLRVGNRKILVMHQAMDEFQTVTKANYKDHDIPASALLACAGWWAGAGDHLCVVRRGRSLAVYRKELDEQGPNLPWKRFKVIPLS